MIEITSLMASLAEEHPIFHSEADFQHALAWHLHEHYAEAKIRLEYRPFAEEAIYLDIWFERGEDRVAIELKYVSRQLDAVFNGERYALKNQSAQDTRRYDFGRDIVRVERVVAEYPGTVGYAVLLTNDSSFWKPARDVGSTDSAFRVHEGARLSGTLRWAEHTGIGTMHKREAALTLRSGYDLKWRDYSTVPAMSTYNRFRYLAVRVAQDLGAS